MNKYAIPYFNLDLTAAALEHHEFLDVGGNTGTINSFASVDIQDLSRGVYHTGDLLRSNNAACFGFQLAQQDAPDLSRAL
jgi:hypothetical protein